MCVGLCDRVPDGVRSMKKTLYRQASERARDYERRVNQVIKRGRIRYGNGYADIGEYRKIRAIDGSLIKVDLELIAKGWE